MKFTERLKQLSEAATPGPWTVWRSGNAPLENGTLVGQSAIRPVERPYNPEWIGYHSSKESAINAHRTAMFSDEDADLITTLRNSLPALIAALEAAEEVCDPLTHNPFAYSLCKLRQALASLEKE